jgi:hypothetical protein
VVDLQNWLPAEKLGGVLEAIFFSGWDGLLRTLVVGVLAYVVLVGFLRLSGKRTLSKMNAFDLVVTVALGSTLATILLSKDVALAEGALAFALLIGCSSSSPGRASGRAGSAGGLRGSRECFCIAANACRQPCEALG